SLRRGAERNHRAIVTANEHVERARRARRNACIAAQRGGKTSAPDRCCYERGDLCGRLTGFSANGDGFPAGAERDLTAGRRQPEVAADCDQMWRWRIDESDVE